MTKRNNGYLIEINELSCVGCGNCEHHFPELFRVGPRVAVFIGKLFSSLPDEVTLQRLAELEDSCPGAAIILPDAFRGDGQ